MTSEAVAHLVVSEERVSCATSADRAYGDRVGGDDLLVAQASGAEVDEEPCSMSSVTTMLAPAASFSERSPHFAAAALVGSSVVDRCVRCSRSSNDHAGLEQTGESSLPSFP